MAIMRNPRGVIFETSFPQYNTDCENLGSGEKARRMLAEYARDELRKFVKPGDTIHYVVRRVSSSGMSRDISFYVLQIADGKPIMRNITGTMGEACSFSESKHGQGLMIHGCGMDMGFHAVYILGRMLYPAGFGTIGTNAKGKKRRANSPRHAAQLVRAGYVFRGRNGDTSGWDNDGGYALDYSAI